jgi:hypothetical protein
MSTDGSIVRLGSIEKTVERKLRRIRQIWAEEVPP